MGFSRYDRGHRTTCQVRQIARDRDAGIVVVTHDPRALEMFDRVVDIVDGA